MFLTGGKSGKPRVPLRATSKTTRRTMEISLANMELGRHWSRPKGYANLHHSISRTEIRETYSRRGFEESVSVFGVLAGGQGLY